MDMPSPRYQAEVRRPFYIESCLKVAAPNFGVSFEKGFQTRRAAVETKSANKYIRTTTENQQENSRFVSAPSLSLSLSRSLSPRDMLFLFVQLTQATQLLYSVSFSRRSL